MAEIEANCDNCQQKKRVEIAQRASSCGLTWSESHRCSFCGSVTEADGKGFPPEGIRQIILAQDGEFQLIADYSIVNCQSNKIIAVKVIRHALCLSISEVKKLLMNFPNLAIGTQAEMQWLQILLLNKGIQSDVKEMRSKNSL